ncbi:hypothetical protein TSOC_004519 [Tetrabaena socialis]|uniref:F-box domain-containing protein n=1 Tax=Tetrabaena socialis TaxID=47790 RepID=A0A2J8A8S8_9CHLO|nr:hypothetical protein TSOC_004519 [Tetrabaena socialis]|eukprot:PNH08927.1 hypothetical protein TSOC_004519 [Tetrabaena socialis]
MSGKLKHRASESDDSSGSGTIVTVQRYSILRLGWALSTWEHNARAMRELRALFQHVYARKADKAMQAAMFDDLQTAVSQAERMGRLGPLLDQLIAAASRVLPKQKRHTVAASVKRAALQMRRSLRKGGDRGEECVDSDGSEDGADQAPKPSSLHDLPAEVVEAIFAHLGPVELARCECVCRCWRELSRGAEEVWRQLDELTFRRGPTRRRRALPNPQPQQAAAPTACQRFREAAAARPRALLRWSGRALAAAGPAWLSSDELRRAAPARMAAYCFPSEHQIVRWACRRSVDDSDKTTSSEGSSSGKEEASASTLARRLWALPK